ncbi:MAG: hypothetical protein ACKVH0_18155 [Alphaproteobacteria bacterium]
MDRTLDLDALLDGALTPEATAEAALAVHGDATVAAELGRTAADAALVRAVLRERAGAVEPAPTQDDQFVIRRLAARLDQQEGADQSRSWRGLWSAAAAIVVLVLGVGGGIAGMDWRIDQVRDELQLAATQERAELRQTIQDALEGQPSGETVVWRDGPQGNVKAKVTPVRTYKSVSGQWCREFLIEGVRQMPSAAMRALACRDENGKWLGARGSI